MRKGISTIINIITNIALVAYIIYIIQNRNCLIMSYAIALGCFFVGFALSDFVKKGFRVMNTYFIIAGVLIILYSLGLIEWNVVGKSILPIMCLGTGVYMVLYNLVFFRKRHSTRNIIKEQVSFRSNLKHFDEDFYGADLESYFGTERFDISKAVVNPNSIINAVTAFGNVEIYVPKDVRVETSKLLIFGNCYKSSKLNREIDFSSNIPTIYVNAIALFGHVSILERREENSK